MFLIGRDESGISDGSDLEFLCVSGNVFGFLHLQNFRLSSDSYNEQLFCFCQMNTVIMKDRIALLGEIAHLQLMLKLA